MNFTVEVDTEVKKHMDRRMLKDVNFTWLTKRLETNDKYDK